MARRKRGFIGWMMVLAVVALAAVGASALYHRPQATKEAVSKTAETSKVTAEQNLDHLIDVLEQNKKERHKKQ